MSKKLMTSLLALVALAAMALPAVASASPELGETSGGVFTRLAVGSKIVGTNVGNTLMTSSAGTIECTKAVQTGDLIKNNGTEIEGTITTASFKGTESEERCSGALGAVKVTINSLPWCLRATSKMAPNEFQLRGGACTEAAKAISFVLDSAFAGECGYSRAASSPVSGTYTTDISGQDATLTVSEVGFPKASGGFLCPSEGKLDMAFTLETDETTTPLYIK